MPFQLLKEHLRKFMNSDPHETNEDASPPPTPGTTRGTEQAEEQHIASSSRKRPSRMLDHHLVEVVPQEVDHAPVSNGPEYNPGGPAAAEPASKGSSQPSRKLPPSSPSSSSLSLDPSSKSLAKGKNKGKGKQPQQTSKGKSPRKPSPPGAPRSSRPSEGKLLVPSPEDQSGSTPAALPPNPTSSPNHAAPAPRPPAPENIDDELAVLAELHKQLSEDHASPPDDKRQNAAVSDNPVLQGLTPNDIAEILSDDLCSSHFIVDLDFERFEMEISLFGPVAVERSVKLGQCDTLEEIAEYVERHQNDPNWRLSLAAENLKLSVELLCELYLIYDELKSPKKARLDIFYKIFNTIASHPFDEKVRNIKVSKLKQKGLDGGSIAELLLRCGFEVQRKILNKSPPFVEEAVWYFSLPIDTERTEVVQFHKVRTMLDELLHVSDAIPDDPPEAMVSEGWGAGRPARAGGREISGLQVSPDSSPDSGGRDSWDFLRKSSKESESSENVDGGAAMTEPVPIYKQDGTLTKQAMADIHENRAKRREVKITKGYQRGQGLITAPTPIITDASAASSTATAPMPNSTSSGGGGIFGGLWRTFSQNASSSSTAAPPPGEDNIDDHAKPYRRSQHFTLKDIEEMRYRDAIRGMPQYAEEWWTAQGNAGSYDGIRSRSYEPAYLGRRALDLTNRFRGTQGLPPLRWTESITEVAAVHARQMARGEMPFDHDGFDERVAQFPFYAHSSAENLAWNSGQGDPAAVAVDGWIKSPGHLKNLMSLTNRCGIGVATNSSGQTYFTQLFAKTSEGLA